MSVAAAEAARTYLFSLVMHGIKLGLDNIHTLLEALDGPHLRHPIVHVAGTNGKGSVLAVLDACLRTAGYRTARFTSPHLVDITERFLLNGVPMPEADLVSTTARVRSAAERLPHSPTFFEVNTAMPFDWFARCDIDVALIEVGMGGRLDSTNVVEPVATAITNIDFDHMEHLGDTLAKIGGEKAGIIKPGVPVVVAETKPEAQRVILARAQEQGAPAITLGTDYAFTCQPRESGPVQRFDMTYAAGDTTLGPMTLGLAGAHQGENAATAITLARCLRAQFPALDDAAITQGVAQAAWPGRLHVAQNAPPVVLDIAHNPAGSARVAASVPPSVVLFGVSSDKDARAMLRTLRPVVSQLFLAPFRGKRALPGDALAALAQEQGYTFTVFDNVDDALGAGLARARQDCPLLVTGSIYLVGEAYAALSRLSGRALLRF